MKTVAILHGWAGGPKLGKLFANELEVSGFKVVEDARNADIIFAHSTGCYFLPKDAKMSLAILINPPYWPGESIVRRWINMNKNETKYVIQKFGYGRFLRNKFWETYYIFAKPSYTWSVLKNQSHLDFIDQFTDRKMVLVRNKEDEFCSPKIKGDLRSHKNFEYVEIPGYHSNYYTNPKPYIDLLLKEL